jgi:hypothetical protein
MALRRGDGIERGSSWEFGSEGRESEGNEEERGRYL